VRLTYILLICFIPDNLLSLLPDCSRLSNDPLDCIQLTADIDSSDLSAVNNCNSRFTVVDLYCLTDSEMYEIHFSVANLQRVELDIF